MKLLKINSTLPLFLALFISGAAASQDAIVKKPVLSLSYFSSDNKVQYLLAEAKWKIEKKYQPATGVTVSIYLDSVAPAFSLSEKNVTDETGKIKAIIPPSLKSKWDASAQHKFIAIASGIKEFEDLESEIEIAKAKLEFDTSTNGETKTVSAIITALQNGKWVPVKEIEMKIAVKRLGGDLKIGDEDTYTTDSTGTVTAEFKQNSLPGDANGNITLVAKVEENDLYGNLYIEKVVPWGVVFKSDDNFFNQRSLWSIRSRTPLWLLFMAYSIVLGVWGTIIYLIYLMFKVKRLGKVN
ncbi:MAG TPA: hypothetical protein VFN30_00720 [Chitinophagaceae bacterium]|nr:hypothetical protein [Chitinophagaceae bacterium]